MRTELTHMNYSDASPMLERQSSQLLRQNRFGEGVQHLISGFPYAQTEKTISIET